jgi:hypothetical protein
MPTPPPPRRRPDASPRDRARPVPFPYRVRGPEPAVAPAGDRRLLLARLAARILLDRGRRVRYRRGAGR